MKDPTGKQRRRDGLAKLFARTAGQFQSIAEINADILAIEEHVRFACLTKMLDNLAKDLAHDPHPGIAFDRKRDPVRVSSDVDATTADDE